MPLKAIIDGETIIGPDLSDREWDELTLRHKNGLSVRMCCCGAPGHLRRSRRGLRHFYHAVATGCNYEGESKEHIELKYLVYRVCQSEGWEAQVEFPSPDRTWISDVYAARDGRKIVFEIQLSAISLEELEERDTKYQNNGIESYWLLDNFLGRSQDFQSWYDEHLYMEDDRLDDTIPYIDLSLFLTGTENHIFIGRGIRSVGLAAKKQNVFTTNNPEIPVAVWVREVLKGNYRNYLERTAAAYHEKHRLKTLAAPVLVRFREWYNTIIRHDTYRGKIAPYYRVFKTDPMLHNDPALNKKVAEIYSEIDWITNEYQSCVSESAGLFYWKKIMGYQTQRPFFRLESEARIQKLIECTNRFARWETSFNTAMTELERQIPLRR
jgi:competence protein CoiA